MEINKLIERFNVLIEKYDKKGDSVVSLDAPNGIPDRIPIEALSDPEVSAIYREIMNLYENEKMLEKQEEQDEIEKLVELGSEEIERLLEELTVGYVSAPKYNQSDPVFSTTQLREVSDPGLYKKLIEAKRICEEKARKTK